MNRLSPEEEGSLAGLRSEKFDEISASLVLYISILVSLGCYESIVWTSITPARVGTQPLNANHISCIRQTWDDRLDGHKWQSQFRI